MSWAFSMASEAWFRKWRISSVSSLLSGMWSLLKPARARPIPRPRTVSGKA